MPGRAVTSSPDHDVRRARLREWLSTGLWFLPMVWALGAMAAAIGIVSIDQRWGGDDPSWLVFGRGPESARLVLSVIAGSTMAFTGTVFSITIVALQLASTQFSPRVLRTFLRDQASQHCFGTFVATPLYSLMVLREVEAEVQVPGLHRGGHAARTTHPGRPARARTRRPAWRGRGRPRPHDLLRRIAVRPLPSGRYGDDTGNLRLIVPQTSWDDYVQLAFDEIRHFGIGSFQVPRRLRAALLDLESVSPPARQAALDDQLRALDDAIDRVYLVADDRAIVRRADPQGIH